MSSVTNLPVTRQIPIPTAAEVDTAINEVIKHGASWPVEFTQKLRERLTEADSELPDGTLAGKAHGFCNGLLVGLVVAHLKRLAERRFIRFQISPPIPMDSQEGMRLVTRMPSRLIEDDGLKGGWCSPLSCNLAFAEQMVAVDPHVYSIEKQPPNKLPELPPMSDADVKAITDKLYGSLEITGVNLRRSEGFTIVSVDTPEGQRVEVIREVDTNDYDEHHITANGINRLVGEALAGEMERSR